MIFKVLSLKITGVENNKHQVSFEVIKEGENDYVLAEYYPNVIDIIEAKVHLSHSDKVLMARLVERKLEEQNTEE